jgi:hypothetical protein
VAEANTALSMRNYEKSALVARLLGVDPALAKIAINTAKSSVSSLVPLSVRKVAINGILDAGLSTLALLAKPGYVLGDVRVKMVQRMMSRKESLPLIFPREDLDFDYSIPVTHSQKVKSLKDSIFGSSSDAEFSQPLLRVGGKTPHSWLSLRHPSLPPSNVTADGSHLHDPSSSSTSPPPKASLLSSVSLCGLTHRYYSTLDAQGSSSAQGINFTPKVTPLLKTWLEAPHRDNYVLAIHPTEFNASIFHFINSADIPYANLQVTLLVDDSQYDLWASALGGQNDGLFRLVAVRRGRILPEGASSTVSSLEHCEVQKVLQQPYYNIADPDGSNSDKKNESRRDEEALLMETIVRNEVENGDAACSRTTVHDFTGRWMEICSRYRREGGSAPSVSGSALYCSIAVRPDGHVAAIFLPEDCSTHEGACRNVSDLRRTLNLL